MTSGIAKYAHTKPAGLLVSVRDVAEAQAALAAGVDLIDVKEPNRGPLGAADRSVVEQIAHFVDRRVPVSVALGELDDWAWSDVGKGCSVDGGLALVRRLPLGVSLAKFGLAGCGRHANWPNLWRRALGLLPGHVAPVAVVYADWRSARAPRPREVLRWAARLDFRIVLVDTFDKSAGGLTDVWPLKALSRFVKRMRGEGMAVVLAGSLSTRSAGDVLDLEPDYVAVRGAACEGGRTGQVRQILVRQLAKIIAAHGARSRADAR